MAVTEPNPLGITSLQVEHKDDGNQVFWLHALDASEREVAFLRFTLGSLRDVDAVLPPVEDVAGVEILITVEGIPQRQLLTREQPLYRLPAIGDGDPKQAQFLELATVRSVLEHEANIHVVAQSTDAAYLTTAASCPTSQLLTSPVAEQCCYSSYTGSEEYDLLQTIFVRPADGLLIHRYRHMDWGACRSDMNGTCSGAGCYYGPNGYSVAAVEKINPWACCLISGVYYCGSGAGWDSPSGDTNSVCHFELWRGWVYNGSGECIGGWSDWRAPRAPVFSNVTGTVPRGQGCPGGAIGAGKWDY